MKKISLLLVGVLALFSCEQEELDNFVEVVEQNQYYVDRTSGCASVIFNTGNGFFQYAAGALYAVFFPHAPVCNSYLAITFPVNVFC